MAKENEGCVQVPNLNSEWTVILVNRNTGLHGQFLYWKIMGPIFIELGLRYLWETQVQMPRIELDVQVWTENLGVVNLFSAVRTIPSPYSQSKALNYSALFYFHYSAFFSIVLHHNSNSYFPKSSVFKVRDPKNPLLSSGFPRMVATVHVNFPPARI